MYNMGRFWTERPRVYPMSTRTISRLLVLASYTPVLLAALAVGCTPVEGDSETNVTDSATGEESTAGPTTTTSESDSGDASASTTTEPGSETEPCEPGCNAGVWDDCVEQPVFCQHGCGDVGCYEVCTPGETQCNGDTVEVCNEQGEGFEESETCDGLMGLTCHEGVCTGLCAGLELNNDNSGCDFYPTVTANIIDDAEFRFAVRVANSGAEDVTTVIHRNGIQLKEQLVPVGKAITIELPWVPELKATEDWEYSRVVEAGAYRLRSTGPVIVYQYNANGGGEGADDAESNDASMLLPAHRLATDYFVSSYPSWPDPNSGLLMPGFYTITALHDSTYIELTSLGGQVVARPGAGVNFLGEGQLVLNRGDVLEVFSGGSENEPGTLSGTRIEADQPVQVIAGHMCAGVPLGDDTCNHLEESMYPADLLGKYHLVVPPLSLDQQPHLQEVHVLATMSGTTIEVNDEEVASNLDAGQTVVLPVGSEPTLVSGTKPISVAQFVVSPKPGETGGPAMLIAQSLEIYNDSQAFVAPAGYDDVFVDVFVASEAPPNVDLSVPMESVNEGYTNIVANYWYQRYRVDPMYYDLLHTVTTISQHVFVSVYGESTRGSAWYPAGVQSPSPDPGELPVVRLIR